MHICAFATCLQLLYTSKYQDSVNGLVIECCTLLQKLLLLSIAQNALSHGESHTTCHVLPQIRWSEISESVAWLSHWIPAALVLQLARRQDADVD